MFEFASLCGVHWVMLCGVVELLASCLGTELRWFGVLIPHCLMWGIWRERRACAFEGNGRLILKLSFFQTLFEWENASGVSTFNSLHDLIGFCTFTASLFRFFAVVMAHCLCALIFLCIFSSIFQWRYLLVKFFFIKNVPLSISWNFQFVEF